MLEIFQKIIAVLNTDPTLTAIVPADHMFTGPVDVTMEKQSELNYPSIVLSLVSESYRSVPTNTRDSQIQLDIWSRNSQMELENIYERIMTLLNYLITDQATAHIFWQRLGGAVDQFESDRRIWHRACTFTVWTKKPN